jgi:hypothetical protein
VRGNGGAQHVEPVQGGFGVDMVLLAGHGQGGIGDGDGEVRKSLPKAALKMSNDHTRRWFADPLTKSLLTHRKSPPAESGN